MKTIILICGLMLPMCVYAQQEKEIIYVGTNSVRESKGIYVFEFNRPKATMKLIQTIVDLENPTYLEIHPSGKYLYSVNRASADENENSGSVTAFTINPKTGTLTFLNHVSAYGSGPCHISIDKTGDWAFISNYNEGNFVVLPILQNGSVGPPSDAKRYFGSSINTSRQTQPHIHSAELSNDNRFVYVSDLGTDKIYTYSLDLQKGKINPAQSAETTVAPGAGPRHFTFHPNGNYAYSAEELSSTVGVFAVDKSSGTLTLIQDTVRSLPTTYTDANTSADIHTDPKGKFLYLSNRGHDALAVFSIETDGTLQLKGHQKTLGKTPRNFLVDKKGKFIWAANQDTDNIVLFQINAKTGLLSPLPQKIKVPSPVCVKQLFIRK